MKIEELKKFCEGITSLRGKTVIAPAMAKITLAAIAHVEAMKPDENGLRPCPCCRSCRVRVVANGKNYSYKSLFYIECRKCGMRTKTSVNKTGLYKTWNTRPDPVLDAVRGILEGEEK